jgi:hypothetical protein
MQAAANAQQGHRYRLHGREVLALSGGSEMVKVAHINTKDPWPLGSPFKVLADRLRPLPMRYFHGETPK